jgi:hypothetical protein
MTSAFRAAALVCALVLSVAGIASAQSDTVIIEQAIAGACTIVVNVQALPAAMRIEDVKIERITVDGGGIDLSHASPIGAIEIGVPLAAPLREGDEVMVVARAPLRSPKTPMTVGRGVNGDGVRCATSKHGADDRDVFELNGFIGLAIDNFAPKDLAGYADSASNIRNRRTFGAIGQYRILGNAGDDRQLWLAGSTLNGLRTTDIDCTDPDQAVLCKDGSPDTSGSLTKNVQEAGVQIVKRATSLEAHLDVRYEFLTLQRESATPAKLFGFYRWGVIDVVNPIVTCSTASTAALTVDTACNVTEKTTNTAVNLGRGNQPTAFSAHYFGGGALIPAGHFRNSALTLGVAKEDIYGSSQGRLRVKVNALGIFDVMPQLNDFSVGKWLGFGAWRFFVALDVDRGTDHSSDTIETYIGFAFDLSKAFHL